MFLFQTGSIKSYMAQSSAWILNIGEGFYSKLVRLKGDLWQRLEPCSTFKEYVSIPNWFD